MPEESPLRAGEPGDWRVRALRSDVYYPASPTHFCGGTPRVTAWPI